MSAQDTLKKAGAVEVKRQQWRELQLKQDHWYTEKPNL